MELGQIQITRARAQDGGADGGRAHRDGSRGLHRPGLGENRLGLGGGGARVAAHQPRGNPRGIRRRVAAFEEGIGIRPRFGGAFFFALLPTLPPGNRANGYGKYPGNIPSGRKTSLLQNLWNIFPQFRNLWDLNRPNLYNRKVCFLAFDGGGQAKFFRKREWPARFAKGGTR